MKQTIVLFLCLFRDIICFLYLFLVTDGIPRDHDGNGEARDVSMKRDEATLIPRFIPRNRRSIIRRSSLKTRL